MLGRFRVGESAIAIIVSSLAGAMTKITRRIGFEIKHLKALSAYILLCKLILPIKMSI